MAKGEVIQQPLIAWATRKDAALWPEGHTAQEIVDFAESVGDLAIDLADRRLRLIEALEFEDGMFYLKDFRDPIPYWGSPRATCQERLTLLDGMSVNWIRTDPAESDPNSRPSSPPTHVASG